jgi:hypothetical protein
MLRIPPLPDEPERSVHALRPPLFELVTRDLLKPRKEIVERGAYERRAFVTVSILQRNAVASDAPISEYLHRSQYRVCCSINFIEQPRRFPIWYWFARPMPAIVFVHDFFRHGFRLADPLVQMK